MNQTPREVSRLASFTEGEEIGTSPWVVVDQDMISSFGAVTRDPDPMHVDPDWAREHSPYGQTIAFGFLTVSLLTHMLHGAMGTSPAEDAEGAYLNYGIDYLRLISPVPVGSRIRGKFDVLETRTDERNRRIFKFGCEVEIEGGERPALVAHWLSIWVPPEPAA
jgi:acyl dehydratase